MSDHTMKAAANLLDKVRTEKAVLYGEQWIRAELLELDAALNADQEALAARGRPGPVDGKITRSQYYEAAGLLLAGRKQVENQKHIERALGELLGVAYDTGDYWGHVSDAMYDHYDVDKLLEKLELKVEP